MTIQLATHLIAEIILCLEYLRSQNIIHRDLKLENIVLDRTHHLKLIDFATAKVSKQMEEKVYSDLNSFT
jgi:serine/threonine protein kinase